MGTKSIDLRSDTLTRPTAGMLRAMTEADCGDDCYAENSSVRELEEYCMELFGKEDGVFMPTGTMSNQVALKSLLARGQEILCDADYHINFFEASPSCDLGGAAINAVTTPEGFLTPRIAEDALGRRARWSPVYAETQLVWTENTISGRGGRIYPLSLLRSMRDWCIEKNISLFLDGARIMNASVATGIPPYVWGSTNDAMSVCFAKGLGAPMGSILLGTTEIIRTARIYRKWYGGALHQSGPIAAAALWALRHNTDRLSEDHENAQLFASVLAESNLFAAATPDTNIVIFDVGQLNCSPIQFVSLAVLADVKVLAWRETEVRAVFSLSVSACEAMLAARRLVAIAETVGRHEEPLRCRNGAISQILDDSCVLTQI